MSNEYPPTTIVLAKVKGYPAWPAMILDEELLPPHILNKKPKAKSHSIPVRFFSDDTYIWITSLNDINPLTKQDIENHFTVSSTKRRKDNLLERAFTLANDPPEMESFIKYGSNGPIEEEEEISVDDEDVIVSKPVRKKIKLSDDQKQKKRESANEARARLKEQKRLKEMEIWAGYDSDWGVDDFNKFDVESGNYIFDSEHEQKQRFKNLTLDFKNLPRLNVKFSKIEEVLIPIILKNGSEEEKINDEDWEVIQEQFENLNKIFNELPKSIINKSKLLRVFILNQRKIINQEMSNDAFELRLRNLIEDFLQKLNLEIRQNTVEELVAHEKKEETVEATPTGEQVNDLNQDDSVVEVKEEKQPQNGNINSKPETPNRIIEV